MSKAIKIYEKVTPERFSQEIRPLKQPAILSELVSDWPAVNKAKDGADALFTYLKTFDNGQIQGTLVGAPDIQGQFNYSDDLRGHNYSRQAQTISQALDSLLSLKDGEGARYIQSAPIVQHLPDLIASLPLPLVPEGTAPRMWIGNQTTVQTHFDMSENIAAVVLGERTFTLFPPDQLSNMYLGPIETAPGGTTVSLTNLDNPDFDAHPKFKMALAHKCVAELSAGDAIYIPPGWFHHVRATSKLNMLINYWWRDTAQLKEPFAAFMHGLLAFRDLPPAQRDLWRHMFDHLVFDPENNAMAHLPPEQRGVLGGISAARRDQAVFEILQILGPEVGLPPPPMPPHIKKI